MKQINILLTRYPDNFSKLTRLIIGNYYSHTSIGIDGLDGNFYSLVTKGFRVEQPYKHQTCKGKEIPCRLYNINVPTRMYDEIRQILDYHLERADSYKYSYLGVILCLLNIALKRENHYFCSQFVSEVLSYAKTAKLEKDSSLYFPDDFMKISELDLYFTGTLQGLISASA